MTLCTTPQFGDPSGSFQWASVEIYTVADDIVQIGYGHCVNTDNLSQWGTTNCNGSMRWYWAWGGNCGGVVNGTGGTYGPIPLRIGAALSSPPSTSDFYVIRETVGGVSYYDGYVDGVLLSGSDALGHQRTARVAADNVCWNSTTTSRAMAWFGEAFNNGDSLGGWTVGGVRDHLDHNPLRFSVNTGWISPSNLGSGECDGDDWAPTFTCTIASNTHIYIDTESR